jgi:O-acetyl-ADP-ribose deacetylase (regulator of RNase III)
MKNIRVVSGNIETSGAEVIVSAANRRLQASNGVSKAIHDAAGTELADHIQQTFNDQVAVQVGNVVVTPAFGLETYGTKTIVHALGPVYNRYSLNEAERLLAEAYTNALDVAHNQGALSIALPAISAGAFGFPAADVARIAIEVAETHVYAGDITFYCWPNTLAEFESALANYGQSQSVAVSDSDDVTVDVSSAPTPDPADPVAVVTSSGKSAVVPQPVFLSKHEREVAKIVDALGNTLANGTLNLHVGAFRRLNSSILRDLDNKALVFEQKGTPLAVLISHDEYQRLQN